MIQLLYKSLSTIGLLLVVSAIHFGLTRMLPGDPVLRHMDQLGYTREARLDSTAFANEYQILQKKLGYDLPWFYLSASKHPKTNLLPVVQWNGTQCQYHQYISDVIMGDWGSSLVDGKPIHSKILYALGWTIGLSFIALVLTYLITLILGRVIFSIRAFWALNLFKLLYAIPMFWLCTLMIIFFTTSSFGSWTNIFPAVRAFDQSGIWWRDFLANIHLLILPIFCIILHDLAYTTRLLINNLQSEDYMPYGRVLQSKGLERGYIISRHLAPNAVIPLTIAVIMAIPGAVGGSLVIEMIFNIPGIGRLLYNAILSEDWNVVLATTLMIAIVTTLTMKGADLWVNLRFPQSQNHQNA